MRPVDFRRGADGRIEADEVDLTALRTSYCLFALHASSPRKNHASTVSRSWRQDLVALFCEVRIRLIPTVAGCDSHAGDSLAGRFVIPGLRERRIGGDEHGNGDRPSRGFRRGGTEETCREGEGCEPGAATLALAAVRDGQDRQVAARIGGMDRQTLRDWVHRFNGAGTGRADRC